METATRNRVSSTTDVNSWGVLDYGPGSLLGETIDLSDYLDLGDEEDVESSFTTSKDGDGAMDSSFPDGGSNQQQPFLASLQASHRQDRPPSQLQDLTQTRNASLHLEDALTNAWTSHDHALTLPRFESTEIDFLRTQQQQQQRLPLEDGDAVMLAVTGASQPSPFDHDRPHHAPSDGPLSPVPTAAADMEGAASTQPATPDAPAATTTPPALPDFTPGEGAQPAADLNPDVTAASNLPTLEGAASTQPTTPDVPAATTTTPPALPDLIPGDGTQPAADLNPNVTAANSLPTLDAPISLAQPFNMGLGMDMSNTTPMPMDLSMNDMGMIPDLMPMDYQEEELVSDERVNAFARLRFDDGSYYMHTYSIILGRNLDLARKDMKRLAKVDLLERTGDHAGAHALLHKKKQKRNGRGAPSVISEKGGIVSARLDAMPLEYQQHRQPSQSASSGSHQNGDAAEEKPAARAPQEVLMQTFPERPDHFDGHVPEDPNDCPLVPIHPEHVTAKTGNAGPKGISRRHAKIFYNFEEGGFCIEVLGNNGLHHEDDFCPQGSVVSLEHGDRLAIGAVNIQFFLPDVALTEQQRQRQESGSRPMSFSFENGNGEMESDEEKSSDSEGQMSINPRQVYYHPIDIDRDSEDDVNDDVDEYEEPAPKKQKIKLKIHAPRPREPTPPPKLSKKQRILEKKKKKKKRKCEERERRREREEDDHSSFGSPVRKAKKMKPPPEEPIRASPTKEAKAIKETKQAKAKESKEKDTETTKEVKETKESKEVKEKGKGAAKAPSKAPALDDATSDAVQKETPAREQLAPVKSVPNDSPPLLRKPLEAEIEAGGEIEGLITEEMARQHNLPASLVGHVVEKRKGPGRPPKDGIMSKRQRSQLIKQAKEIERAKAAGIDPADIPAPSIKPKITKRKESNAGEVDGDDILESTELGDGTTMDKSKQKQPIKPPRTPSPEMRIEDYSEEQLQRPSANYVVLIHEAISSSPTGQMNLQQIYTYIEKKYPWYKFKTTTSGWQSSVRHNLGQHDAFVKGDKEGKGFNWRINPEVSIEKERRKRQNSPVVNHAQRPQYYPPPNGYPPYPPQPGYPYHPGMPPPGMPPAMPSAPRLPAGMTPRLPPSMARDANVATPAASQGAPPPSPYASPWAGGNTAGSPSAPMPPRPYPQAPHGAPPASSAAAGSSGQYGVLYPTSAPPAHTGHANSSPYGGPYAGAGASPYAAAPNRPYAPYPPQGYPQSGHPARPQGPSPQSGSPAGPPSQSPAPPAQPPAQNQPNQGAATNLVVPHIDITPEMLSRYPSNIDHGIIRNLEVFRFQYTKIRNEPEEATKIDKVIRAFANPDIPRSSLNELEQKLWDSFRKVPNLRDYRPTATTTEPPAPSSATSGDAAVIAAAGAASTLLSAPPSTHHQQISPQAPQQAQQATPQQTSQQGPAYAPLQAPPQAPQPTNLTSVSSSAVPAPTAAVSATPVGPAGEPHKFTPNMTVASTAAPSAPVTSLPTSHRPSVEPLTPVPGSPAVQTSTLLIKRSVTEITADDLTAKKDEHAITDDQILQQAE